MGDVIWVRHNADAWLLSQVPEVESALVSINPHDGAIEALVGGYSFSQSQYNRVTQAKRQLGSNIKPFIYTAALEKGYTLATLINNAPINKPDIRQGTAWRPKNSPDVYGGPTRLRIGLAKSINVMSVRAMRHAGLDYTIQDLEKFGFNPDDLPHNESIALGSASVTPMQVVTAFATFANGGYLVKPFYIDRIQDPEGHIIEQSEPTLACTPPAIVAPQTTDHNDPFAAMRDEVNSTPTEIAGIENPSRDHTSIDIETCGDANSHFANRIVSAQDAFLITQALKSVIWGGGDWAHGTGWNGTAWRASKTVKRHDIAGKTGTTNESRDTWFSGFTPNLATTVWVGFDDHGRELGRTTWNANDSQGQITGAEAGAKTAGPGWNEFMKHALQGVPEAPNTPPPGIVSVRIDRATGLLTRKTDYTTRFEYFISGTEPTDYVSDTQTEEGDLFNKDVGSELFQ